ncbi:CHAT domain-containing tetratricopeptide repeat protein [Aquimarina sp. 2201CG1-2-11]|uniref:CHAT domain-containing protein n=1 Tax=Aquimarina discodermiae TaxID=3231043 RepID=UPI0034617EC6
MICIKPHYNIQSIFLFVIFLWFSLTGLASTQDTVVASQNFKKRELLLKRYKPDSAVVYFKKSLVGFEAIDHQKRMADCYDKLAKAYKDDFDQALMYAQKGLEVRLCVFGDHTAPVATSYMSIGGVLKQNDQFKKAMENYQKALTIRKAIFGKNDHRTADSYHEIGVLHHVLAQYEEALFFIKKGLSVRKAVFGGKHEKVADSYYALGKYFYDLSDDENALLFFKKSLEIRTLVFGGRSSKAAFCYRYLGMISNRSDKHEEALSFVEKAMLIFKSLFGEDHPNVAWCYSSLMYVYRYYGNGKLALENSFKAQEILNKKFDKKHSKIAFLYFDFSKSYFKLGKYDLSLKYKKKCIKLFKDIFPRGHKILGYSYNDMGAIYYYDGEYDLSLQYFKKAVDIYLLFFEEGHNEVSRTYNNIANVYRVKKEYDVALMYYQKALALRIKNLGEGHSDTSFSYYDIGEYYMALLEYNIALVYYQKALQIQERLYGETSYYICDTYNAIAKVFVEQKQYHKALKSLQRSLRVRLKTNGAHHPRTVKSYNQLADVCLQMRHYDRAVEYYEKAIVANNGLDKKGDFDFNQFLDKHVLLATLYGKAKVLQERYTEKENVLVDNLVEREKIYQTADDLIGFVREKRHAYKDKLAFAEQVKKIYTGAIEVQMQLYTISENQQYLEKAFYYSEKSRASTLKELITESNAKEFVGLPSRIVAIEQDLKSKHAEYISRIMAESAEKNSDSIKIAGYESELFEINRREDSLVQVIEKEYPKYHQLKYQNNIVSVQEIQNRLDENTTILEFFVADTSAVFVFMISKDQLKIEKINTKGLTVQLEKFKKAIVDKNTSLFKELSHSLYQTLLKPVENNIAGDRLIMVPDDMLWGLNFELLCVQKDVSNNPMDFSYLLKEYEISYANSINVLYAVSQNKHLADKQEECLAFSFSDDEKLFDTKAISLATLRAAKEDLPGTRKEIREISNIIDGQYYFGAQAIEANFKKNAEQYNILHLALHGEIDNERPENSKLLFTKTKDTVEDNYLYSHELFAMNIPAELTVLSACNTGAGKIAKGEGVMSLGNAFQYAGTKSLLLSRWEISDRTTPVLMKYFYTNLKTGMNKSRALQQAKLQYLNTADINRLDPFYWGGFYLIRDVAPIPFQSNTLWYWVLIFGLIVLLGVFLYYRTKRKKGVSPL